MFKAINAASMAVRELGYSRARALEQIGESDPAVIMEEAKSELLEKVDLEIEKQKRLALGKVEIEEAVKQAQGVEGEEEACFNLDGRIVMEEMISRIKEQGRGGQTANRKMLSESGGMKSSVGGPGFDPARGGNPPAMAAPGMTPEVREGERRGSE